jgi:hypothetical protein
VPGGPTAQIVSAGDSAPPYAVEASPGFAAWLNAQNAALAITTYQIRSVTPTTMASADFCRPSPAPCGAGRTPAKAGAGRQTSQGKMRDFRSIHLSHLRRPPPDDFGLQFSCPPRPGAVASMRFLFVRPELCVQLASDPASQ